MGLFSILKGDTLHFNRNAVPVWNDIFARVNTTLEKSTGGIFITEKDEKEILLNVLEMAQICVLDMLFHPDTGVIKNKVKSFDKEAFYILYEIIIFFLISTFKNVRSLQADELKAIVVNALERAEECNVLWDEMNEHYKDNNKMIKMVLNKISYYTGKLGAKEESDLISALRGLVITFVQSI